MISNEIREKFQDVVRGACLHGAAGHCSAVRNLLVESFGAGSTVKSEFESRAIIKKEQARFLLLTFYAGFLFAGTTTRCLRRHTMPFARYGIFVNTLNNHQAMISLQLPVGSRGASLSRGSF